MTTAAGTWHTNFADPPGWDASQEEIDEYMEDLLAEHDFPNYPLPWQDCNYDSFRAPKRWLTISELAKFLEVRASYARRLVWSGIIPSFGDFRMGYLRVSGTDAEIWKESEALRLERMELMVQEGYGRPWMSRHGSFGAA